MKKKIILVILILLIGLVIWALNDPFNANFKAIEDATFYTAAEIKPVSKSINVKVVNYNAKFGGGRIDFFFNCIGDRVLMDSSEVYENLDRLVEVINGLQPDILTLQEVDINSHRCASIDMVQYILDHTDLNYGIFASQWKSDLIPKKGLKHINSGSAILSKWKFEKGVRHALPAVSTQDPLTRYFYLKRNFLEGKITIGTGKKLTLLTGHLSAYDKDGTRAKQLNQLTTYVDSLHKAGERFLFAGDLNLVSPYATKLKGFDDCQCEGEFDGTDYTGTETLLQPLYDTYEFAISPERLKSEEEMHYTHSVAKDIFWNRKIDYVFATPGMIVKNSGKTHQVVVDTIATMSVSDHAPISVELVY